MPLRTPNPDPAKTLRVAFVLPGLGRVRRGAEAAFVRIAEGLRDSHGFEVRLFGGGDQLDSDLPFTHVPCISRTKFERFPSVPALRSDCQYEEMTFALGLATSREFAAGRFDAVVTCSYPYINWLLQRGRWADVPHLFVAQNGDWMCRTPRREFRYFRADRVACITPQQQDRVQPFCPTTLIPNGVDADRFAPRQRAGTEAPDVLMVGALIESKRVLDGIEAVAAVPDARLTVVGDGPLRDAIRERLERCLPERHDWQPRLSAEDTARKFERADVFLHMSREEPFGLVYLEAMAAGCPTVAHNGPTQRWICGDAAVLCDTGDPRSVLRAIQFATDSSAARLSAAGPARVADGWTWDTQIDRYAETLRDLVRARNKTEVEVR